MPETSSHRRLGTCGRQHTNTAQNTQHNQNVKREVALRVNCSEFVHCTHARHHAYVALHPLLPVLSHRTLDAGSKCGVSCNAHWVRDGREAPEHLVGEAHRELPSRRQDKLNRARTRVSPGSPRRLSKLQRGHACVSGGGRAHVTAHRTEGQAPQHSRAPTAAAKCTEMRTPHAGRQRGGGRTAASPRDQPQRCRACAS